MLGSGVLLELESAKNTGDVAGYYGILIDNDIGYGALALGAATDGDSGAAWADFGGVFANNFLEAAFFSTFDREMLESEKQGVRESLITADYALRSSGSGEVDNNAIRDYHHKIFEDRGIPRSAWTGTFLMKTLVPGVGVGTAVIVKLPVKLLAKCFLILSVIWMQILGLRYGMPQRVWRILVVL